jgi:hypothetical protein
MAAAVAPAGAGGARSGGGGCAGCCVRIGCSGCRVFCALMRKNWVRGGFAARGSALCARFALLLLLLRAMNTRRRRRSRRF